MASPLRARLLAAKDIPSQIEVIPEWADETGPFTLEIRGLTGAQQVECSDAATVKEKNADGEVVDRLDNKKHVQQLVLKSLRDPESGALVLENADADALWQKSGIVLNRLAAIVMRLNGLAKDETEKMEKNSDATTSGAGASA